MDNKNLCLSADTFTVVWSSVDNAYVATSDLGERALGNTRLEAIALLLKENGRE